MKKTLFVLVLFIAGVVAPLQAFSPNKSGLGGRRGLKDRVQEIFDQDILPDLLKQIEDVVNKGDTSENNNQNAKESPLLQPVEKNLKKEDYVGDLPQAISVLLEQNKLENKEYYERFQVDLPRAILLTGPPGTGKTLIAKIIAGELGFPFFELKSVASQYHGSSERQLTDALTVAKNIAENTEHKTVVVFIDEIDNIGKKRSSEQHFNLHNGVVTALLTHIDGISTKNSTTSGDEKINSKARIIIIGATNFPETLDEALMDRFNAVVEIGLPDLGKRKKLLSMYVKGKGIPVSSAIDFEQYAYCLEGFSARDINNIAMEARKIAAFENASELTDDHLEQAIVKNFGKVAVSIKKSIFSSVNRNDISNKNIASAFFLD